MLITTRAWTTKYQKHQPCVLLLGGFDGLHAGHKKLVEKAKTYALPIGIMTIIGGKNSESLFTLEERYAAFEKAGVDFAFTLPFTQIKDITAGDFCSILINEFQVQAFVCGDDFHFGKGALGTPTFLKEYTQVCVEALPLVCENGKKISSTDIKVCLQNGDMPKANRLLGENFFLQGTVVKDRQIGRTLGFPTANILYPQGKVLIKKGVYETRVEINGKTYKAVTNFGARPTFQDETVVTETYIDEFDGNLYGQTLQVSFKRYLRDVQKFDGEQALKAQLQEDIRRVREND